MRRIILGEWRQPSHRRPSDLTKEEQSYLRTHAESFFRKQEPWQEELLKQLERAVSLGRPAKV